MIPILDSNRKETGRFKKTLADVMLPDYDKDIMISIKDPVSKELKKVPVWRFIERYIRITTKKGKFICFELKLAQIELYKELCLQKRQGKNMRINILKARQLGMSTFIAALYTVLTLLVPNQTAVIVADKAGHATNIFKKYKFMYHNLPTWIKDTIPLMASNAKEVTVDYGDGQTSSIKIVVADEDAGRSDTCQYLHLSEVASWKTIEDTLTALLQVVDDTNENSMIIFETTAKGVNEYKYIYDLDSSGETAYTALFYPWWKDPEYVKPYWGFELLDHEKKLLEELHLTLDQIAWYRSQYEKLRKNLDKVRQEYPSTPLEAFITSGSGVFPMGLVQKRKAELIGVQFPHYEFIWDKKIVSDEGDTITLVNPQLSSREDGVITIYQEVEKRHPYIVNVDPAMGGEDSFVAHVWDNHTHKQVAKFRINKSTNYQWIAAQIYCLTRYYNKALLNGECNNSTGTYILQYAASCGHDFIYQDTSYENKSERFEDKYGYKLTTTNRDALINLTVDHFTDDYQMINDYLTLCEMENFQVIKNEKTGKEKREASTGHDDHVTAMFGVFLARRSLLQTTELLKDEDEEKKDDTSLKMFRPQVVKKKESFETWD